MSSSNSIVNILHARFGKFIETLAKDAAGELLLNKLIPYDAKAEVGDTYNEAVVLGAETGYSIIGNTTEVSDINPAVAGAVKQASVSASVTILRSVIPWSMASRSEKSEGSFVQAMKYVVRNHVLSHKRFLEILKVTGKDIVRGLGRVSYATATYRGVSLTAGAGTFATNQFGSSITIATGGVDTTNKYILLQPGDNASGYWSGMQGMRIKQVTSAQAVVASGKVVGYDSFNGIIKVDFTPVAATSAGSHYLCLDGMESQLEFAGVRKILTNTGSLFGISASTYNLWRAYQSDLAATKLTFAKLISRISDIINQSGASGTFDVLVNSRSFATLVSDESALRSYDSSYSPEKYQRGARSLEFTVGEASIRLRSYRYVMEGDCFILNDVESSWICSGSSDVAMSIPGLPLDKLVVQLQDQSGVAFHTFADTYLLCREPAKQGIITGINDESAT